MPLSQVTRVVSDEKLCFLPAVLRQRIANSGDLLGSERMQAVLSAARPDFDQLLVDLPPLGPVSDARAISPLIDAFILVVNWGHTRFDVIEEALAHFGIASDKIVGVVLNKVNFHELRYRPVLAGLLLQQALRQIWLYLFGGLTRACVQSEERAVESFLRISGRLDMALRGRTAWHRPTVHQLIISTIKG